MYNPYRPPELSTPSPLDVRATNEPDISEAKIETAKTVSGSDPLVGQQSIAGAVIAARPIVEGATIDETSRSSLADLLLGNHDSTQGGTHNTEVNTFIDPLAETVQLTNTSAKSRKRRRSFVVPICAALSLYLNADQIVNSGAFTHIVNDIAADSQCGQLSTDRTNSFEQDIINIAANPNSFAPVTGSSAVALAAAAQKYHYTMLDVSTDESRLQTATTTEQVVDITNEALSPVEVRISTGEIHATQTWYPGILELLGVHENDSIYRSALADSKQLNYLDSKKFTVSRAIAMSKSILNHYRQLPDKFIETQGVKQIFIVDTIQDMDRSNDGGVVFEADPTIMILTESSVDKLSSDSSYQDVIDHESAHANAFQTYANPSPPCEFTNANPSNFSYVGFKDYVDIITGKKTKNPVMSETTLTDYGLVDGPEDWADTASIAYNAKDEQIALSYITSSYNQAGISGQSLIDKLHQDPRIRKLAVSLEYADLQTPGMGDFLLNMYQYYRSNPTSN